ncbi:MAG: hypothetical protein JNN07_04635 [Verrucomicrobiales bacterium]|nr:hypothetical protein [Verrucomicrobiales bacterium]
MSRQTHGVEVPKLRVGTAQLDISPPLEVGLLMSSVECRWAPFVGRRAPLRARALVLEQGGQRWALLSLDLLGLSSKAVGGWAKFKRTIGRKAGAGWSSDRFVITCTHTHSAPDSLALSTLYQQRAFKQWIHSLSDKLATVLRGASAVNRPCTLEFASTTLPGYWMQRRIPTATGIALSDQFQPIPPSWLDRKPVDRRVRTLRFRESSGEILATVVHAACHPVNEMCLPYISPDYPGTLCDALSSEDNHGLVMFLNGASADLNPLTVSEGRGGSVRQGSALAAAVRDSLSRAQAIPNRAASWGQMARLLPTRTLAGAASQRPCRARLNVWAMGSVALLFLPGEIFVETGRSIEERSPFEQTLVVSYAEDSVGYVCPPHVLREGGYEAGPGRWAYLAKDAEPQLRKAARKILEQASRGPGARSTRRT